MIKLLTWNNTQLMSAASAIGSFISPVSRSSKIFFHFHFFSQFLSNQTVLFPYLSQNKPKPSNLLLVILHNNFTSICFDRIQFVWIEGIWPLCMLVVNDDLGEFGCCVCWSWMMNWENLGVVYGEWWIGRIWELCMVNDELGIMSWMILKN